MVRDINNDLTSFIHNKFTEKYTKRENVNAQGLILPYCYAVDYLRLVPACLTSRCFQGYT